MAIPPVPHTWTAGDDATSTVLQTLTDAALWSLGSATSTGTRRAFCRLRQTSAQSIPNGVWTALNFDTEDVDYDAGHESVTHPDRYTANTTGWYEVDALAGFPASATGDRGVRITVNGTAWPGSESVGPAASATHGQTTATAVLLNAGDVLRVEVWQTVSGGGALFTSTVAAAQCSVTIRLVSN